MAQCEKLKDLPRHQIEQCSRRAEFEFDVAPKGTFYKERAVSHYCHFHLYEAYVGESTVSDIRIAKS